MQTINSHLGSCTAARIAVPHFLVPRGVRPVLVRSGMTVTEAAPAETKPVTLVSFGELLLSRASKPTACHSPPHVPQTVSTYVFGELPHTHQPSVHAHGMTIWSLFMDMA